MVMFLGFQENKLAISCLQIPTTFDFIPFFVLFTSMENPTGTRGFSFRTRVHSGNQNQLKIGVYQNPGSLKSVGSARVPGFQKTRPIPIS